MTTCTTIDTLYFGVLLPSSSTLLKDKFPLCNINRKILTNDVEILFYCLWGPVYGTFLMNENEKKKKKMRLGVWERLKHTPVVQFYGYMTPVNFKFFAKRIPEKNLIVHS